MRLKYAIGNWKMNGSLAEMKHISDIASAASELSAIKAVICPPAPYLSAALGAAGAHIGIGGQDCHMSEKGAHTGDVSAAMIADLGARYVILGHSERRTDHSETDAQVSQKAIAALGQALTPILCVGETRTEREEGRADEVVRMQITSSFEGISDGRKVILAYEPVWAIGTGLIPTMAQIADMFAVISEAVSFIPNHDQISLLYGGSVNGENAAEIFALNGVDGALVGGASLTSAKFAPIMQALAKS